MVSVSNTKSKLALYGGKKTVPLDTTNAFKWPQLGKEEVQAVAGLIKKGEISISGVTYKKEPY